MSKSMDRSVVPVMGEGKRGADGYTGYLLRQAGHAYRNKIDAALRDVHLTQPQFAALTMLDAYPDMSSADLARLALLTPQTMSTIIGNLDKAGLIGRKPHAVHGRKQQIELTAAGRQILAKAKERVYAFEADLACGFSEEDQAVARRWLVAVATGKPD